MSRNIEIVRETDDAVFYLDDWDRKHNADYAVRKAAGTLDEWDRKRSPTKAMKYLCIGGPLDGQKLATVQMPGASRFDPDNEYVDFNQADGIYKHLKMVRFHKSLLKLDDYNGCERLDNVST